MKPYAIGLYEKAMPKTMTLRCVIASVLKWERMSARISGMAAAASCGTPGSA